MCLHPALAVALGEGERSWAEGLVWHNVQALFLWMNSCRAVCTSPSSICRVQRLVLGKLRKTIAHKKSQEAVGQCTEVVPWVFGGWKYWSVV